MKNLYPISIHKPYQQLYRTNDTNTRTLINVFPKNILTQRMLSQIYKRTEFIQTSMPNYMIFQLEDSDDNIKIIYQNSHLWDPIQFNYNAKTIKSAVASLYQIYTHYLSNHQSIDFSLDQIYFDGHQYLILDYGLDYEFFAEMCIGGADVSKVYQATMAPEMLQHKVFNKKKSPTWSFGVIMMTLLANKRIHPKIIQAVLSNSQFEINQIIHYLNFPLDIQNFLKQMLIIQPEYRISWQEIEHHPLLKFDIEKCRIQPFYEKLKKTMSPTSISMTSQQYFQIKQPEKSQKKLMNLSHYKLKTELHYQRIASSVQLQTSVLFEIKKKVKNQLSHTQFAKQTVLNNLRKKDKTFRQISYMKNMSQSKQSFKKQKSVSKPKNERQQQFQRSKSVREKKAHFEMDIDDSSQIPTQQNQSIFLEPEKKKTPNDSFNDDRPIKKISQDPNQKPQPFMRQVQNEQSPSQINPKQLTSQKTPFQKDQQEEPKPQPKKYVKISDQNEQIVSVPRNLDEQTLETQEDQYQKNEQKE